MGLSGRVSSVLAAFIFCRKHTRLALGEILLIVLSHTLTASKLPYLACFVFFRQSDTAPPLAASLLVYLLPQKYKSGSNP